MSKKFSIGDKVIPINKTRGGSTLDDSIWRFAKDTQKFLYIISKEEHYYRCNLDPSDLLGDHFNETDLIKAYTIEDLQNAAYSIWVHCSNAEQMARLGKYYYSPGSEDYGKSEWEDMNKYIDQYNNETGCYIGNKLYNGGWNPWYSAKSEEHTIEFNQVIFPKEDKMENKKVIGYKLLKDLPHVPKSPTVIFEWDEDYKEWVYKYTLKGEPLEYSFTTIEIEDTTWFEPVYQANSKKFTLSHKEGEFSVEVFKDRIATEDGDITDIGYWEQFFNIKQPTKWAVKIPYLNIGCKRDVPLTELHQVYTYWKSLQ